MAENDNENDPGLNVGGITKPSGTVARIAASFLNELGYARAAEIITRWPEMFGQTLAKPFRQIQALTSRGEAIPAELEAEARAAIAQDEARALPLLGVLFAAALEDVTDADSERAIVLSSYRHCLGLIADVVIGYKTSLALRGFLHRDDCVSYWRFEASLFEDVFAQSETEIGMVLLPAVVIYLLDIDPSDDNLAALNKRIRRDPGRRLPDRLDDHGLCTHAQRVQTISEFSIVVRQSCADELLDDPCDFKEARFDETLTHDVPDGAPTIEPLLVSLVPALRAQSEHLAQLRNAMQRAPARIRDAGDGRGLA
jgi:hypothetical protein